MPPTTLHVSSGTTGLLNPEIPRGDAAARLEVTRTDIQWRNVAPDVVRLEVAIHNRGGEASAPERMQVNAAPFGAFVPSTSVASIGVPPIPPGGSVTVAHDFEDPRGDGRTGLKRLPECPPSAPGERIHWVGNFDVHVRDTSAERHASHAVRLVAGAANVAFCFVGGGIRDLYRFGFRGEGAAWSPRVLHAEADTVRWLISQRFGGLPPDMPSRTRRLGSDGRPYRELVAGVWHKLLHRMVCPEVHPPAGTREGRLEIVVTKQSTLEEAVVEFGFGPDTVEPRCFRS